MRSRSAWGTCGPERSVTEFPYGHIGLLPCHGSSGRDTVHGHERSATIRESRRRSPHDAACAGVARAHRRTPATMPALPKLHRRERAKAWPSLVGLHTVRPGDQGRRNRDERSGTSREIRRRPSHGASRAGAARTRRGTMPPLSGDHRCECRKARRGLVNLRAVRPGHRGRGPTARDRTAAHPVLPGLSGSDRTSSAKRPHMRQRMPKRAFEDPRRAMRRNSRTGSSSPFG